MEAKNYISIQRIYDETCKVLIGGTTSPIYNSYPTAYFLHNSNTEKPIKVTIRKKAKSGSIIHSDLGTFDKVVYPNSNTRLGCDIENIAVNQDFLRRYDIEYENLFSAFVS